MNKQPEVTEQTRKNLIAACFDLIKNAWAANGFSVVGTSLVGKSRCQGLP